jgi:CubicO group peptidase (beta-lactamase class C family)
VVAHILDEEGAIHLGDRVAEYIPEFGSHGKDVITIAHVLSHRAELPNLWAVMRRIAAEAPKSDSSALAFPATR